MYYSFFYSLYLSLAHSSILTRCKRSLLNFFSGFRNSQTREFFFIIILFLPPKISVYGDISSTCSASLNLSAKFFNVTFFNSCNISKLDSKTRSLQVTVSTNVSSSLDFFFLLEYGAILQSVAYCDVFCQSNPFWLHP